MQAKAVPVTSSDDRAGRSFFDLPPKHTQTSPPFLKLKSFSTPADCIRKTKKRLVLGTTLCLAKKSTFHLLLGLLLSTYQAVLATLAGFLDMLGDALKDHC